MVSDNEAESVLRNFETDVLDRFHESIPFYQQERSGAIYAALAAFDSHIITELMAAPMLLPAQSNTGAAQIIKGLDEGFSQAIRWLVNSAHVLVPSPQENAELIQDAAGFVKYASQYVDVADFHRMYGRGQVSIEVDKASRRVRFVIPQDTPPGQALQSLADGFTSQLRWGRELMSSTPSTADKQQFQSLLRAVQHTYENGRVSLADPRQCLAPEICAFFRNVLPTERHYLESTSDLVGFTFSEFDRFFHALRAWSLIASMKYVDGATSGMKQEMCMPTQVVDRGFFVANIAAMASLTRETVEKLVGRLSYDDRTNSPDIFQQPLLVCGSSVSWSARCVINSRHVRNKLKLMARTPELSDHAATLVGTRELAMLQDLGRMFSEQGKSNYQLRTPVAACGDEGEIDLVVANHRYPEELLLVELKSVIDADEINEMEKLTTVLVQGQMQLEKIERILKAMTLAARKIQFKFVPWEQVNQVFKIVVSPHTLPHQGFDHSTTPAITIDNIFERMRANHFGSPMKFWQRAVTKPWLQEPTDLERYYRRLVIGDVTYEMPALRECKPNTFRGAT